MHPIDYEHGRRVEYKLLSIIILIRSVEDESNEFSPQLKNELISSFRRTGSDLLSIRNNLIYTHNKLKTFIDVNSSNLNKDKKE
jgi:hypothetical protein